MRPSWPEFLLLALPLVAAIIPTFFAFRAASYLLFGVIGLLVGLCTINIDAEERGVTVSPLLRGYSVQLFRAWKTASHISERVYLRATRPTVFAVRNVPSSDRLPGRSPLRFPRPLLAGVLRSRHAPVRSGAC